MSTSNLSSYEGLPAPSGKGFRIAVVVSEWNTAVTESMFSACIATLKEHEVPDNQVIVTRVPGSYELTSAAQMLLESNELDAVICLGCIIKGETPHDEHIASAVANGITRVSIDYSTPVIFGVLTTLNQEQAEARSGGKKGNKGVESAITALKMAALRKQLI